MENKTITHSLPAFHSVIISHKRTESCRPVNLNGDCSLHKHLFLQMKMKWKWRKKSKGAKKVLPVKQSKLTGRSGNLPHTTELSGQAINSRWLIATRSQRTAQMCQVMLYKRCMFWVQSHSRLKLKQRALQMAVLEDMLCAWSPVPWHRILAQDA